MSKKKPAVPLVEKYNWKRVEAPRSWKPAEGEELVGFYAGRTIRNGDFGQYDVILVAVPSVGMRMVTGVQIVQLVDAAQLTPGDPVRVRFNGMQGQMKSFDLYVAEGERAAVEDLPGVRQ